MADSKGGGGMGMNMVTTVMAFSVSALFVFFVFFRLLCARLHLGADHAAAHAGDAFVLQTYNTERGMHGLEPSVVTSLPSVKLGDGDGAQRPPGQEEAQCTVCLEEYEAKDVVRVLPACGHAFHAACIDAWLRQHPTCPVCRASLRAARNRRATPLDYSLAAATRAPASSGPLQAPASSSDDVTASPHQPGRLEIVYEEPGSSDGRQSASPSAGCGETARQTASSATEQHR